MTASAKLSTASWLTASSPRIRSITGAMRKKKAGMAENEYTRARASTRRNAPERMPSSTMSPW